MDIDIGLAVSNIWNTSRATIYAFSKSTGSSPVRLAVESRKIGGKTGVEVAQMVGIGKLKPQQDLCVYCLKMPVDRHAVEKMVKKGGIPFYGLTKAARLSPVGFLRSDEKHKPGFLRKKTADKPAWTVTDKRNPVFDAAAMRSIRIQATLNGWAKKSGVVVRILEASRRDSDATTGFFALASDVKGKTPQQLESILGFRKGTYKNGVNVFTAKTSKLSISNVDMKGYTNTPNGEPTDFKGLSKEQIKKKLETMPYPPGKGVVQFKVTKKIAVKKVTTKAPLGYKEKVKI